MLVYRIFYVAFVFIGALAEISIVWLLSDCFNALMALPNLIAIIALSGVIKSATVSIVSPSFCHEVMGLDAMILVF